MRYPKLEATLTVIGVALFLLVLLSACGDGERADAVETPARANWTMLGNAQRGSGVYHLRATTPDGETIECIYVNDRYDGGGGLSCDWWGDRQALEGEAP